ncbi:MAG: hypothetical protein Q4G25_03070, partial [Paracoccus sp. (in: a-proteobacteria)]|nr:hypothetical protein [Paracoccus sp. (in: a-proteobacteria)]
SLSNASMALALGGKGATGGVGGAVHVTNSGEIHTTGDNAHGILAQSVGGGGGTGGGAITGDLALTKPDGGAGMSRVGLGLGGNGGAGNEGGTVVVDNTGKITVSGRESHGIFAQSVGGGGGAAVSGVDALGDKAKTGISGKPSLPKEGELPASVSLALNVGGQGGKGGRGGDVTVNHSGEIVVAGPSSYGILAQSVGGGGGAGSARIATGAMNLSDNTARLDLGARSGQDNVGGKVTVNSTGSITVLGEDSMAILNQSVSGGGGVAAAAIVLPPTAPAAAANRGGAVASPAATAANGATAPAIRLVAGLGGSHVTGAAGRDVTASHKGDLLSAGARSLGDLVQTIGGGGGISRLALVDGGGSRAALAGHLGGTLGRETSGGAIDARREGVLLARGAQSLGRVAQSIGGGGGVMVAGRSDGAVLGGSSARMIVGGTGGADNDGHSIALDLSGDTGTVGNLTGALVVQSIGAGGGTSLLAGFNRLAASIGGSANARGDGGDIRLSNAGRVQAVGDHAQGVIVQSIGGGGGLVLSGLGTDAVTVTRRVGSQGDGGAITYSQTGQVEAAGKQSVAILLQSLGGGGGVIDNAFRGAAGGAGKGGAISFALKGNAYGDGEDGIGIFAQSAGRDGAGNIGLDIDGVVVGGTGAGNRSAGIIIDGGAANTIRLSQNTLVYARNNLALLGGAGNDAIHSDGLLVGNIAMGGGTNRLETTKLAYTRSLDYIDLGHAGMFVNNGFLDPGGRIFSPERGVGGVTKPDDYGFEQLISQTTDITGALVMGAESRYLMDARFLLGGRPGNGQSDLLLVSGDATMGGTLLLRMHTLERAVPLSIILAGGAVANSDTKVADTVFLDYEVALNAARPAGVAMPTHRGTKAALRQAGTADQGGTIDLIVTPRFKLEGMTRNEGEVGGHINAILNGDGSASLAPLFTLLGNMTDRNEAFGAINLLTAEGYASSKLVTWRNGVRFNQRLAARAATPFGPECRGGTCGWLNHDETSVTSRLGEGFEGSHGISSMGMQWETQQGLRFGVAYGQEHGEMTAGSRFAGNYDGHRFGIFGFMTQGEAEFQGALSFGESKMRSGRVVGLSGKLIDGTEVALHDGAATVKTEQIHLNLGVATNRFTWENGTYLRPLAEVDLAWQRQRGEESGLGPYGLAMDEGRRFLGAARLSAELGHNVRNDDGSNYRAFIRGGVSYNFQDNAVTGMRFIGAPDSAPPFEQFAPMPRTMYDLSVGMMGNDPNSGIYGEVRLDAHQRGSIREVGGSITMGMKF